MLCAEGTDPAGKPLRGLLLRLLQGHTGAEAHSCGCWLKLVPCQQHSVAVQLCPDRPKPNASCGAWEYSWQGAVLGGQGKGEAKDRCTLQKHVPHLSSTVVGHTKTVWVEMRSFLDILRLFLFQCTYELCTLQSVFGFPFQKIQVLKLTILIPLP